MNKKRIGIVIQKYGQIGGAENFTFNLTERLAKFKDLEIHVFANEWERGCSSVMFHKVPMIKYPRWLKPISFAYFASRAVKKMCCDIVHSHERIFNMDILTYHGIPHVTWAKRIKKSYYLSWFDRSTIWTEKRGFSNESLLVLPVSSLVKDELLGVFNIPEDRIEIIHPGIELSKYMPSEPHEHRKKIRQLHNISNNDVVILFVSMNFEIKNLDLVLQAIAHLSSHLKSIKLLVAGKGNTKKYTKIADSLGISENVIFTGVVRNIHEYYLASDIFVLPSQFDTFALVVLEAMASGLPVIISSNVGAKDIIDPDLNGIILPENYTSKNMAEALERLMNLDYRKSLAKQALKTAELYSWDNHVNKIKKIYDSRIDNSH
jgi:UDP-glucose:(heptosyl)LPS alpha-1,3-glucosyltransferase